MGQRGRRGDPLGLVLVVAALAFGVHVLASPAGPTGAREAAWLQAASRAVVVALLAWHWWRLAH
jgi:hypothetical protein